MSRFSMAIAPDIDGAGGTVTPTPPRKQKRQDAAPPAPPVSGILGAPANRNTQQSVLPQVGQALLGAASGIGSAIGQIPDLVSSIQSAAPQVSAAPPSPSREQIIAGMSPQQRDELTRIQGRIDDANMRAEFARQDTADIQNRMNLARMARAGDPIDASTVTPQQAQQLRRAGANLDFSAFRVPGVRAPGRGFAGGGLVSQPFNQTTLPAPTETPEQLAQRRADIRQYRSTVRPQDRGQVSFGRFQQAQEDRRFARSQQEQAMQQSQQALALQQFQSLNTARQGITNQIQTLSSELAGYEEMQRQGLPLDERSVARIQQIRNTLPQLIAEEAQFSQAMEIARRRLLPEGITPPPSLTVPTITTTTPETDQPRATTATTAPSPPPPPPLPPWESETAHRAREARRSLARRIDRGVTAVADAIQGFTGISGGHTTESRLERAISERMRNFGIADTPENRNRMRQSFAQFRREFGTGDILDDIDAWSMATFEVSPRVEEMLQARRRLRSQGIPETRENILAEMNARR